MDLRLRHCIAECFGTACLVFSGTGAIVINDISGGSVSHVGVALTFGLIVLAMIFAIGDVSGAHINPAVTLGFCAAGEISASKSAGFIFSQLVGAIWASVCLRLLFPGHDTYGATHPAGGLWQSFFLEVILTTMLMFVILSASTGPKEKGSIAAIAISSVVGLEALFAGPICGASMNPARSIGPALVSMNLADLWIYIAAPIIGAVLAVGIFRVIHDEHRDCEAPR